jgi:hypothetical protein
MTTYTVTDMRVVPVIGKMKDKYPDRVFTVHGNFHKDGNLLSFNSKVLTADDISHPDFTIDLDEGTLTLNEGQRGRKKNESLTQEQILAELNAIRNSD